MGYLITMKKKYTPKQNNINLLKLYLQKVETDGKRNRLGSSGKQLNRMG